MAALLGLAEIENESRRERQAVSISPRTVFRYVGIEMEGGEIKGHGFDGLGEPEVVAGLPSKLRVSASLVSLARPHEAAARHFFLPPSQGWTRTAMISSSPFFVW